MTTSTLTSGVSSSLASGTSASNTSSSSSSAASKASGSAYALTPQDFISLMVTQLKNQDPLSPASDSDLLSQMSNIGQLESSTSLQTTMSSVNLQSQVGAASALIGKTISGINTANDAVSGVVSSVNVAGSNVTLNLESGDTVAMTNVSSISPTPPSPTATSGT